MSFWCSWKKNLFKLWNNKKNLSKQSCSSSCHPYQSTNISSPLFFPFLFSLLSLPQSLTDVSPSPFEDSFRASVNLDLQSLSLKLHFWHSNIKYLSCFAVEKKLIHPLSCLLPHTDFAHVFKCFFTINLPCPMPDPHLLPYHNDILLTKSKIPFRKFGTQTELVPVSGKISQLSRGLGMLLALTICPPGCVKPPWGMEWEHAEKYTYLGERKTQLLCWIIFLHLDKA